MGAGTRWFGKPRTPEAEGCLAIPFPCGEANAAALFLLHNVQILGVPGSSPSPCRKVPRSHQGAHGSVLTCSAAACMEEDPRILFCAEDTSFHRQPSGELGTQSDTGLNGAMQPFSSQLLVQIQPKSITAESGSSVLCEPVWGGHLLCRQPAGAWGPL